MQPVFFRIKAQISFIKPDQAMWYRGCKTCNKKVTEAIGSGYWCEGCQKNDEECRLRFELGSAYQSLAKEALKTLISNSTLLCQLSRYIMVMRVSDASGEAWLSVFNEQAEKIIGCSADELDRVKSQVKRKQVYTPLFFWMMRKTPQPCDPSLANKVSQKKLIVNQLRLLS